MNRISHTIYFSPTGTTKKLLGSICRGFGSQDFTEMDFTHSTGPVAENSADQGICLIGSPVYAGRLPSTFLSRIAGIDGGGRLAVLVVVYGNREFEDALAELYDFAVAHHFRPVAVGAFIGEHSYSTPDNPLASGRPDGADVFAAVDFGRKVRAKVESGTLGIDLNPSQIPGNRPYKPVPVISDVAPTTDPARCTKCLVCVEICPVQAIQGSNPLVSDGSLCIRCCACIKACPEDARTMDDERIRAIARRLAETCTERKVPTLVW